MSDVWDKTTPLGTEAISLGDDRIRELKSALETALSHESTFPGASPSTAPIFIPGFLRGVTGSRPTANDLVSGRLYCNTTLNVLERYNGASWDVVGTVIPAGTVMLFYQAAAPTGWTAVAVNNKFLRVVSAGGTGGTTGGSGLTPSSTITLAHTHTVASHTHTGPAHTHTITAESTHTHTVPRNGWSNSSPGAAGRLVILEGATIPVDLDGAGGDNTSGAGGAHDHGAATGSSGTGATGAATPATDSQLSDTAFQYADVIVATKD